MLWRGDVLNYILQSHIPCLSLVGRDGRETFHLGVALHRLLPSARCLRYLLSPAQASLTSHEWCSDL